MSRKGKAAPEPKAKAKATAKAKAKAKAGGVPALAVCYLLCCFSFAIFRIFFCQRPSPRRSPRWASRLLPGRNAQNEEARGVRQDRQD